MGRKAGACTEGAFLQISSSVVDSEDSQEKDEEEKPTGQFMLGSWPFADCYLGPAHKGGKTYWPNNSTSC